MIIYRGSNSYIIFAAFINDNTFQIITLTNKICEEICPIIRKKFCNIYKDSDEIYEIKDHIIMKINTPLFKNGDSATIIDIENIKKVHKIYTIKDSF